MREFTLKRFKVSPTSNIIVEYSFDITLDSPRVWSMSGHPVRSTAGHFLKIAKNLSKNRPKMAADPQHYVQYVVPHGRKII